MPPGRSGGGKEAGSAGPRRPQISPSGARVNSGAQQQVPTPTAHTGTRAALTACQTSYRRGRMSSCQEPPLSHPSSCSGDAGKRWPDQPTGSPRLGPRCQDPAASSSGGSRVGGPMMGLWSQVQIQSLA